MEQLLKVVELDPEELAILQRMLEEAQASFYERESKPPCALRRIANKLYFAAYRQ